MVGDEAKEDCRVIRHFVDRGRNR